MTDRKDRSPTGGATGITVELLTARWTALLAFERTGRKPEFVPVRISLGAPKFLPHAEHFPYVKELAPLGLRDLSGDEFEQRYLDRLEKIGIDKIGARLAAIHADYLKPIVLFCFEDVTQGQVCHRRMFARWWEAETGQQVPEALGLPDTNGCSHIRTDMTGFPQMALEWKVTQ